MKLTLHKHNAAEVIVATIQLDADKKGASTIDTFTHTSHMHSVAQTQIHALSCAYISHMHARHKPKDESNSSSPLEIIQIEMSETAVTTQHQY